jgi:hypothetical protein
VRNRLLSICATIEMVVKARDTARPRIHLLIELIGIGRMLAHVLSIVQVTLPMVAQCRLRTLPYHVL